MNIFEMTLVNKIIDALSSEIAISGFISLIVGLIIARVAGMFAGRFAADYTADYEEKKEKEKKLENLISLVHSEISISLENMSTVESYIAHIINNKSLNILSKLTHKGSINANLIYRIGLLDYDIDIVSLNQIIDCNNKCNSEINEIYTSIDTMNYSDNLNKSKSLLKFYNIMDLEKRNIGLLLQFITTIKPNSKLIKYYNSLRLVDLANEITIIYNTLSDINSLNDQLSLDIIEEDLNNYDIKDKLAIKYGSSIIKGYSKNNNQNSNIMEEDTIIHSKLIKALENQS